MFQEQQAKMRRAWVARDQKDQWPISCRRENHFLAELRSNFAKQTWGHEDRRFEFDGGEWPDDAWSYSRRD